MITFSCRSITKTEVFAFQYLFQFLSLLVITSCASRELTIKTNPATATVTAVDFESPTKRTQIGKGEFKIQMDSLAGKTLLIEDKGQEPLLAIPLNLSPAETLSFQLSPKSTELEKKISGLETNLEIEKRNTQALGEKLAQLEKERHRVAQLVARFQNAITQNSVTKANALSIELFKLPENVIPAVAYTLRGKLRLLEQKRSEARLDFTRALQIFPQDLEAKSFLDNLK